MPITNNEKWNSWAKNNKDPYGKACVDVARRVMQLLDENPNPLKDGYHPDLNTPHGIICKADEDTGAGGITGFMAGCVAQMVSQCHSRGEEFRKIWNGDDSEGVKNPALLTISKKE